MKMDVTLFLLAFTMFWKLSHSVKCYKCAPEKSPYGTPPCSQFNYSQPYLVDCNASTMCFKRETTLVLGDGVSITVERGCASQTLDGDQRKINGKWKPVKEVYEVYEESCKEHPSDYQRPTKTVHCYCRGDYCNESTSLKITLGTLFTVLVSMLVS